MEGSFDDCWQFFEKYMDQLTSNQINSKMCQSSSGSYIIMWRKGDQDFKFNPAFFLIGSSLGSQRFEIKLVTYQGTLLDEQLIDFSCDNDKPSFTELVHFFCSDRLRLCKGFLRNPSDSFLSKHSNLFHEFLMERLEKDVVVRSKYCQLVAAINEEKSESMCLDCSSLQARISAFSNYNVFHDDPYELGCDHLQIDEETIRSNLSLEQIQATLDTVLQPPSPGSISESELFGLDHELFGATTQRGKALNDPEIFLQTPPPIHTEHELFNSPSTSSEFITGKAGQHRSLQNVVNSPHLISVSELFDHPIIELQLPVSTDILSQTVSSVQAPRTAQTVHILPSSASAQPPHMLRRTIQAHLLHRPAQAQFLQAIIHTQHPTETCQPSNPPVSKHMSQEPTGETATKSFTLTKSDELAYSSIRSQSCKVSLARLDDSVHAFPNPSRVKDSQRECINCGKDYVGLHIKHIQEAGCQQNLQKSIFTKTKKDQKLVSEDPKNNQSVVCDSSLETSEVFKDLKKNSKMIKDTIISNKRGPKLKTKCCSVCNKNFKGLKEYKTHVKFSNECRSVIRKLNPKLQSSSKDYYYANRDSFVCSNCQKRFSSLTALEVHMACIHKVKMDGQTPVDEYYCDYCGQLYLHKMRLNEHIALYHNKEKWDCRFCDKTFPVQNKLIVHQVSIHMKIKPFQCPECDYEASEMSNVYTHCQRHHGYRATSENVRVNSERLQAIRETLQYDYFGKTTEKVGKKSQTGTPKVS